MKLIPMDPHGNDFLYIALGVGALWLILKNSRPLSNTVTTAANTVGETINNAGGVVNPLLGAAAKGAAIITNPQSWELQPMTGKQYLSYAGSQPVGVLAMPWLYATNLVRSWISHGWN